MANNKTIVCPSRFRLFFGLIGVAFASLIDPKGAAVFFALGMDGLRKKREEQLASKKHKVGPNNNDRTCTPIN